VRVIFLGTAGATITPRPACRCRVCSTAREKGLPYSRLGPSVFVEPLHALFDTPEEIAVQLNRAGIFDVDHVFYSHWHPDHTGGRRIFEQLNVNWQGMEGNMAKRTSHVYLPPQVFKDFESKSIMSQFQHFIDWKLVTLHKLRERQSLKLDNFIVECIRMRDPSVYAYLLTEGERRVLLALDDTYRWDPPANLSGVDLAVLEMGWFEKGPDGEVIFPENHPIRQAEASFEETLEKVRKLQARRAVLTHIDEVNRRTYDDFKKLENEYKELNLTFAYDGLIIDV
jgi:phosphoribosyl 1,2-cyclic phosphate phosphodiesterase